MTAPRGAEHPERALPPIAAGLPWPNVRGKRCLDLWVAGSLADELERRGAAEVVSVEHVAGPGGPDLDADGLGTFDVTACPGLLSNVGDPLGALKDVHRVTAGMVLSAEPIALWRSVLGRGRPWSAPEGLGVAATFNAAAHKQLLEAAGFAVERTSRPYVVPSAEQEPGWGPEPLVRRAALRTLTGSWAPGLLHRAVLARRRP